MATGSGRPVRALRPTLGTVPVARTGTTRGRVGRRGRRLVGDRGGRRGGSGRWSAGDVGGGLLQGAAGDLVVLHEGGADGGDDALDLGAGGVPLGFHRGVPVGDAVGHVDG